MPGASPGAAAAISMAGIVFSDPLETLDSGGFEVEVNGIGRGRVDPGGVVNQQSRNAGRSVSWFYISINSQHQLSTCDGIVVCRGHLHFVFSEIAWDTLPRVQMLIALSDSAW